MVDRSVDRERWPLRRVLDAAGIWCLVLAVGIGFLGLVLQRGLQARAGQAPAGTGWLAELQARVAAEAGAEPGPALQRLLDEALAQAPQLQAIDLVADDGRVRLSTEPSAVGRPADEGLTHTGARAVLLDARGRPLGTLVAHAVARDGAQAAAAPRPLVLVLALGLPLAVLLLLRTLSLRRDAPPEQAQGLQRLRATRQRLARAAQEIEWLEASGAEPNTGVFTRTGATQERARATPQNRVSTTPQEHLR
jgi:hypothetical protein